MGKYDSLKHPTMGDIEVETSWFKFFTNKSLIGTAVGAIPGMMLFVVCRALGLIVVGVVLVIACAGTGFLLTFKKKSAKENVNSGGGDYPYVTVLKKIVHKMGRGTYIKHYGVYTKEFWEDDE